MLVHRLLAVSIEAECTTPELLDKRKIEALCQNLNVRTRMSAYAERASVALNTHVNILHLKKKNKKNNYYFF